MSIFYHCPPIAFCDTDAGGVVYHTKYLEWAERARADFLTHAGLSNKELWNIGLIFAVTDMNVKYHKPAVLGDLLTIQTHLTGISRVRVHLQQTIVRNENVLVSMRIDLACLSKDGKPKAMGSDIYQCLTPFILNRSC